MPNRTPWDPDVDFIDSVGNNTKGIIRNITRYGFKSIFCIIRLLGGFGMVLNTPTGCGNNLPILLRSNIFLQNSRSVNIFLFGPIFDFFRDLGTREV